MSSVPLSCGFDQDRKPEDRYIWEPYCCVLQSGTNAMCNVSYLLCFSTGALPLGYRQSVIHLFWHCDFAAWVQGVLVSINRSCSHLRCNSVLWFKNNPMPVTEAQHCSYSSLFVASPHYSSSRSPCLMMCPNNYCFIKAVTDKVRAPLTHVFRNDAKWYNHSKQMPHDLALASTIFKI